MSGPRVAVVGAGAWGTTLAAIVAKREPVLLVCHRPELADEINRTQRNDRRLPDVELPEALVASADPVDLVTAVDLVVFATPSPHLRDVAAKMGPHIRTSADVLSVVKGLESGTLLRMSEVIAEAGGIATGAGRRPVRTQSRRGDRPGSARVRGRRRR